MKGNYMRKGHKPTYNQSKILTQNKKDYKDWFVVKVERNQITFRHRTTNEILELPTT